MSIGYDEAWNAPRGSGGAKNRVAERRILLIDDDPGSVADLRTHLEPMGLQAESCTDL